MISVDRCGAPGGATRICLTHAASGIGEPANEYPARCGAHATSDHIAAYRCVDVH